MFWQPRDKQKDMARKHQRQIQILTQWAHHFHTNHEQIHQKQQDIVAYLHHVHATIGNLQNENRRLKDTLSSMKQHTLTKAEVQHLIAEHRVRDIDTQKIEDALYDRIKEAIPTLLPKNPPAQNITAEEPVPDLAAEPAPPAAIDYADGPLSYSEKLVLNILFSADTPLSYEQIGSRLNKRPGTIKVYVNNLKRKGIDLEEYNGPGNVKLHALTNREKVRKLYNLPQI